jgi:mannose-6-phosphate isomerase-like protein (cupin superfamily)
LQRPSRTKAERTAGDRSVPTRWGEWVSEPGILGTPLQVHRSTDEAFYVLEGTFGFRAGERTFAGSAGTFVFVPRGVEHAFWNEGSTWVNKLIAVSPPGLEGYFQRLADALV